MMVNSRVAVDMLRLAVTTAAILTPAMVWSVPLSVGDNPITGTTTAARPELAGVVVEDVLTPYEFVRGEKRLKGEVQNRVVRSAVDGTIDFYWRIRPDSSSTGEISAFRVDGFGALPLDGDWRIDGLGTVAPDTARNFGGGAVNFLFSTFGVGPSSESRFFFLDTEARHYTDLGQYDMLCADTGCISPLFPTFVPVRAGDADEDLDFDQFDLVQVLAAGKYRTGRPATWGEGDWTGDGVFDQFDIVAAQKEGIYTSGRYSAGAPGLELAAAPVPEPASVMLLAFGVAGMWAVIMDLRRTRP